MIEADCWRDGDGGGGHVLFGRTATGRPWLYNVIVCQFRKEFFQKIENLYNYRTIANNYLRTNANN